MTMDMRRIKLEIFEGPLDLLLHLIRKNELDIATVSLAAITDQYLSYLELMQELNIELASEFLVIAAELARLKSRALLPHEADEALEEEDGAFDQNELIERLLRYQQFKRAAQVLSGRLQLGIDLFKRSVPAADLRPVDPATVPIRPEDPEKLAGVCRALLSRNRARVIHQVAGETVSVRQKMIELLDFFHRERVSSVRSIVAAAGTRAQKVGVFLAILELVRMRMFRLFPASEGERGECEIARHDHGDDGVAQLSAYQEEFRA